MIQIVIFVIVSVPIVWYSWRYLLNPRHHGFFRFFAWECILALILLNIARWFADPFSAHQIVSWLLLCLSLVPVIYGFYLLRTAGKPRGAWENTTTLIRVGVYKYIRHPLYASLLILAWGVFFKDPSLAGGVLVVAASAFLYATARVEEIEMLEKFGTEYAAYMRETKRFVPFVF
jgi:protein-S-isoprenylcysteine O-methyltransferase Ste14